jgi:MoxR-like ATPase
MTDPWPHPDFPESVELPPLGHLPRHRHLFAAREVWAIKAALGARRPLLVRGLPGTGKTELARAAAEVLHRPLIAQVISARTRPEDLHYTFDAVARLGQAQLLGVLGGRAQLETLDKKLFLEPGRLWWVFDWNGAKEQYERASVQGARPPDPSKAWGWTPQKGTVLLIDEIDKADPDLPNGLLETLGNGEFAVPLLGEPVRCSQANAPPLVIITTNEERELPAAFVRRCLVLQLSLPQGTALEAWLIERGRAHFGERVSKPVYERAARLLVEERESQGTDQLVRPGQAEYLDLLRAVLDVAKEDPALQEGVLEELQGFAMKKNAPE